MSVKSGFKGQEVSSQKIAPGQIIDRKYRLDEQIANGGGTWVFAASDLALDRKSAVKIISAQNELAGQRFERECRAMANVKGRFLPDLYSWGRWGDNYFYIAMEFVEGKTLAAILEERVLSSQECSSLAIALCEALQPIHKAGLVHRDLKPSNIMVKQFAPEIEIVLLDFGIVHFSSDEQSLTKTNQWVGTMNYASPEHFEPKKLDARSDIFSLGCVLFKCLSSRDVFVAEQPYARVALIKEQKKIEFVVDADAYLKNAIRRCLKSEPKDRFQSVDELKLVLKNKQFALNQMERLKIPLISLLVCLLAGAIFWQVQESNIAAEKKIQESSIAQNSLIKRLKSAIENNDMATVATLLDEMEKRPSIWWRAQNFEFVSLLLRLGNLAAASSRIDIVDKSCTLGTLALARQAKIDKEMKHNYFGAFRLSQLECHFLLKDVSPKFCSDAEKFLAKSLENRDEFEILAYCILAKIERYLNHPEKSSMYFQKSLKVPCSSMNLNRDHIYAATEYLRFLASNPNFPEQRRVILGEFANLSKLLQSRDPLAVERVVHFAALALPLPVQNGEQKDLKWTQKMYSVLSAIADFYEHDAGAELTLELKTFAAQFESFNDRKGALADFEKLCADPAPETLRGYTIAVTTALDYGKLEPGSARIALLQKAYAMWEKSNDSAKYPELMHIGLKLIEEFEREKDFDKEYFYCSKVIHNVSQVKTTQEMGCFRGLQLQSLAAVLLHCSNRDYADLIKKGLIEFDRLVSVKLMEDDVVARTKAEDDLKPIRKKYALPPG